MIRILMAICSYPRDRCEEPKWRTTGEWCVRWAPSVLLRPRGRNRDGRRRWWEEPFRPQARSLATHSLLPSPAPGARHSLTPFLATLGALFRHPNPPPCIPLATVSQSHSSAVGKGPASSPHSLHCVSVPRYTPPADRDRDRPASSFLSWTAGPSPGAPPPSAPLTPFTRRRLAAGVMRGVRNGPSFFRPITALRRPCRRNRAKEVTAFHSFPPSLRSGVSLPFPTRLSPPSVGRILPPSSGRDEWSGGCKTERNEWRTVDEEGGRQRTEMTGN